MKHSYSDATTRRYIQWRTDCVVEQGDCEPPKLAAIERWLRDEEEYRDPLNALRNLCVGLLEADHALFLQQIACALIPALEDEREFGDKAGRFFDAMVRRCGVDDTEVNMYDKHTRVGTLHDLGLAKKEKTDA